MDVPNAVEESDCDSDTLEMTSTDSSEVQNFLSRLRALRRSYLTCKRKVRLNMDRKYVTLYLS